MNISNSLKLVPIFGSLHLCRWTDHRAASRELALSLLISLLPVLAILFIYGFFGAEISFAHRFDSFIASGELLLVGCAVVGPLCYTSIKTYRHGGNDNFEFPHKLAFLIAYILIVIVFTAAFVAIDLSKFTQLELSPGPRFATLSVFVLITSVTLVYMSLLYRNAIEYRPGQAMIDDTERFVQEWGRSND